MQFLTSVSRPALNQFLFFLMTMEPTMALMPLNLAERIKQWPWLMIGQHSCQEASTTGVLNIIS